MGRNFRLEGIYNQLTLEALYKRGFDSWVFDMRPKSFNFVQQYVLNDCLKYLVSTGVRHQVYLRFHLEKDFMLKAIVEEAKNIVGPSDQITLALELSDKTDCELAQSLEYPFVWQTDLRKDSPVLEMSFFRGMVLSSSQIHWLASRNELGAFAQYINTQVREGGLADKDLIFSFDWTDDLMSSFLDFLPFKQFSLPLNSKVESHYRNLDQNVFEHQFSIIEKRLLSNSDGSRISPSR